VRRKTTHVLATAVAASATALAATAATPSPVKAGPRNEVGPAASDEWFAWSKSRAKQVSPLDLWAQRAGGRPFRVNPKKSQAYAGGIDGARLYYQLIHGRFADRSDIMLFDLNARRLRRLPSGINTPVWECCATGSGDWLLFSRGHVESRDRQLVLLRNLVSGELRVLDTIRNRRGFLSAGQLNGTFAVWVRCNPRPCQLFRYDVSTATATALSTQPGKSVYAPSINQYGTVYYAQSNSGCGKSVELVKQRIEGPPEVLAKLPEGKDVDVTYSFATLGKSPSEIVTTWVYYDLTSCRRQRSDIYRVVDTERIPPTP
jgi:hypothetical protein